MARLTKRTIDATAASGGEKFLWDDDLPAFGLRIKASGVRSFFVQYRNSNGRSRRFTLGRYGVLTADQARDAAKKVLAAVALGGDPAAERKRERTAQTVEELCRDYLAKARAGLIITRRNRAPKKATTVYTDHGRIERHIIPLLGTKSVKAVTSYDIERFRNDVSSGKTAADVKTGPRGRAIVKGGPGTSARTLGLLGGIFSFAVSMGMRDDNPVRGIVRAKDNNREVRLDRHGYRQIGNALRQAELNGAPWQAVEAAKAIALTGARRGEIERLRKVEVDLTAQVLRLGDSKTGRSVRPIGKQAARVLRTAMLRSEAHYVFPSTRSPDKPYRGLPKVWRRDVEGKTQIKVTPHGLRHAFSSVAEDLGFTIPTIKALLGHSNKGSVTEGYIHKTDAALVAAANDVASWIAKAMGSSRATEAGHDRQAIDCGRVG